MTSVTCIAPVNIALIKYWGKRDESIILPLNDSLSITLSTDEIHTKTTVLASKDFDRDRMWLNGEEQPFDNSRLLSCIKEMKRRAKAEGCGEICEYNVRICSVNNFPTAAGLASSAAGYACLMFTLAQLYSLKGDISDLARLGSGSACRSVLGGFVRWHAGVQPDGNDSVARQVAPDSHWPEMRVLILVVNDRQKSVSSTIGMRRSVATSELLKHRVANCVPQRIVDIEKAIREKDFGKLAEITMMDSNQFHAIALDTYPPCVYMNDVSHRISSLVHAYNKINNTVKVAYSFDAGPNACLFLEESAVPEVAAIVHSFFPSLGAGASYWRGPEVKSPENISDVVEKLKAEGCQIQPPGELKQIIYTRIGEGPKIVPNTTLLNEEGLPFSKEGISTNH